MAEKTPVVTEKKNPFAVPVNSRAVLLIPIEGGAANKVAELMDAADLLPENEDDRKKRALPRQTDRLKLSKLTTADVIFTAIPHVTKTDRARKQPVAWELKISKGVPAKDFLTDLDEDSEPNLGAIVDALQPACHPFHLNVTQDHVLTMTTV